MIKANDNLKNGKVETPSAECIISMRKAHTPGMNVSDSDVSTTSETIIGRVGFQTGGSEMVHNVSIKTEADTNALHCCKCSCSMKLYVPCGHVTALHQRISLTGRINNLPSLQKIVHEYRSCAKLRNQYGHAPNDMVGFGELQSSNVLPGSMPSRAGCISTRRLVKVRSTNI